ncbi:MAG: hypothetical protein AAGE52_16320 [Myxococcota bacterium]
MRGATDERELTWVDGIDDVHAPFAHTGMHAAPVCMDAEGTRVAFGRSFGPATVYVGDIDSGRTTQVELSSGLVDLRFLDDSLVVFAGFNTVKPCLYRWVPGGALDEIKIPRSRKQCAVGALSRNGRWLLQSIGTRMWLTNVV